MKRGVSPNRHGMSRSPEYKAWQAMLDRCRNENNQRYDQYGGRGIVVCDEWAKSFEAFFEHVGKRPSDQHSIDRIKNDRGYEPGNIRWATPDVQIRNTRRNIRLTILGRTQVVSDWSLESGVNVYTIMARLRRGWDAEHAVFTPPNPTFQLLRKGVR